MSENQLNSTKTELVPHKNKKPWSIFAIGLIGLITYLALAEPSRATFDGYLKQEVYEAKTLLIDTNQYEATIDQVPRSIRQGVVKNKLYLEAISFSGVSTGSIVGRYIDYAGAVHYIELTNAHAIPSGGDHLTIEQPNIMPIDIPEWDCAPLDYLQQNPSSIDSTEPVSDLMLCDLNTGRPPEALPSSIKPIDPSFLSPEVLDTLDPTSETLVYGFPAKPDDINYIIQSQIAFVATMRPTGTTSSEGQHWFEGDPYAAGGSGSPAIIVDKDGRPHVFGILTTYLPEPTIFPFLYTPAGPFEREFYHGVTPLPDDIWSKIQTYTTLRQQNLLPVYPEPTNQWWQQRQ